jgi:hypothetical protein
MSNSGYWDNQRPDDQYGYGENSQQGDQQWQQPSGPPPGYANQTYHQGYDQNRTYDYRSPAAQDYEQSYTQHQHYQESYNQYPHNPSQYEGPAPAEHPYGQPDYSAQSQSYGYGDEAQRTHSPYPAQPDSQYEDFNPPPGPPPASHGGPYPPYESDVQADPNDPNAQDRGLMGAVAGGALGAYGGHKVHHGFLGAVAGAITGSVAEDAYKKHKKDKKNANRPPGSRRDSSSSSSSSDSEKKKKHNWAMPVAAVGAAGAGAYGIHQYQQHHQQQPPHQGPPSHGPAPMRGNFSASAQSITLDRDYDLIASCADVRGQHKLTSLSLNSCLSNQHGHFAWGRGGNFGASSRNVRLIENGRVLEAELGTGDGRWNLDHIRLDERVSNNDGELIFLES